MDYLNTDYRLKRLLKIVLLSATFFALGTTALTATANAADTPSVPPAIYNGSDNYSKNNVSLKSAGNGLSYGARLSMDGSNSMYTGDIAGTSPMNYYKTAIFNLSDYKDIANGSNLSEEVQIENSSDTDQNITSIEVDLPTAILMGYIDKNHPEFQYGSNQAVTPDTDSSGMKATYYAGGSEVTSTSSADQWFKVNKVIISGTLKANGHYDLNLPLKLTNASQINVDNIANCFETHIKNGTNDYSLFGRFTKGILLSKYAGEGKPYGIVLKVPEGKNVAGNETYSYPQATDVQPQMPDVVLNADTAEVNNSFFNDGLTYFYNGSMYTIHFGNMKAKNNSSLSLIDYLNQNGYGMPLLETSDTHKHYLMTDFTYRIGNASTTVSPTYPAGTPVYSNGLGMQVVKIIDVKGLNYQDTINLPVGSKWNAYDNVSIWNPDTSYQESTIDKSKIGLKITSSDGKLTNNELDTSKAGTYHITYSFKHSYPDVGDRTISKTITVIVGNQSSGSGTGSVTTPSSSSSAETSSGSSATGSSSGSTTTTDSSTTKPSTSVGPNTAVEGEAVYATKKIGLYKSTSFKKANRIAWYPKQKRTNRPMFVVTGYKRNGNGTLRYKVRDVNHGRKTAGKTGYITASQKYVVPVYYASVPKSKKITVIAKKGVNAYKSAKLTGKAKHYKKGTHLRVKKLVKHNLTMRYQLTNGKYVTTNKKLIIAGDY